MNYYKRYFKYFTFILLISFYDISYSLRYIFESKSYIPYKSMSFKHIFLFKILSPMFNLEELSFLFAFNTFKLFKQF